MESQFSVALLRRLAPTVILLTAAPDPAAPAEILRGPVEARAVSVLDGDTLRVEAMVWPGQVVRVSVRVRGIDAPEMKSRCSAEQAAALRARSALDLLVGGAPVLLSNIGGGKYYGRVLADVTTAEGVAVGPSLLARSLVRPYAGGKRQGWCG
jgi:endonuclease YncB( thermonuclease family)